MEQFYYAIIRISYVLLTISLIIAISKYNSTTKNEKWYIYYIIFIFFIELTSYIISFTETKNNSFMYPVYIAGEFFTVTGIFIKKLSLSKYCFIATGILTLFFLTADRFIIQYNNDYSKAISNLIMISLIAYSLIQNIKVITGKSRFLLLDKMFFFYFLISVFIFLLQSQLISFPIETFYNIWIINNIMVVILYTIIIKTFLSLKK